MNLKGVFLAWIILLILATTIVNAEGKDTLPIVPLHRYWAEGWGDHFYTTDPNELGDANYVYEGTEGYVFPDPLPENLPFIPDDVGLVPLHRYWNEDSGDHVYTTNWDELGRGDLGYIYEGIACWVFERRLSGANRNLLEENYCDVPYLTELYRYWNDDSGDHFYTIDYAELGEGRLGYVSEDFEGYVFQNMPSC